MRGRVLLAGITALVFATCVSAAAPPTETHYVAQLRQAAAQVEASLGEVTSVNKEDSSALTAAGQHLSAAAAAACQTMRTYQHAGTRFGTDEEYQLVQKLGQQLAQARSLFGTAAGVTLKGPTKKQLSAAEELLRDYAQQAAHDQVARWLNDERLADILTSGDIKKVGKGLEHELARRIDAAARYLSKQATGLSLSLGAPLPGQVRAQAEQAALNWLSRTVLRWDATGLAIQLVGVPVVRFLRSELQQLLRDHKHVQARTDRTVTGFNARMAELQKLVDSADSASLSSVRRLLSRAQRAIDATVYLKSDLRKQRRSALIARLDAAEALLKAKIGETRAAFLLDSQLARSNLRRTADNVCKLKGETQKIVKKLASGTASLKAELLSGGGRWTFGRVNGAVLCSIVFTSTPGKYGAYVLEACHPNESYWRLEGRTLVFLHADGTRTSELTRRNANYWQGPYLGTPSMPSNGTVHYIRR